MATTSPARIDDDLYASAKLVGEIQSRSASQQVAHWARIGRELEASSDIAVRDVADVLSGAVEYDTLDSKAQAVVRAAWTERMQDARRSLNFSREFDGVGRTWVELDDDGQVVRRGRATTSDSGDLTEALLGAGIAREQAEAAARIVMAQTAGSSAPKANRPRSSKARTQVKPASKGAVTR